MRLQSPVLEDTGPTSSVSKKTEPRYRRLKSSFPTSHLFIGNCGDKTGFSDNEIRRMFEPFGPIDHLIIGDGFSFVSLSSADVAIRATQFLDGKIIEYSSNDLTVSNLSDASVLTPDFPASHVSSPVESGSRVGGVRGFVRRPLIFRFCERLEEQEIPLVGPPIPENASSIHKPVAGIRFCESILNTQESSELLAQIDSMPWESRLKRRVQHYGCENRFEYNTVCYTMYVRFECYDVWVDYSIFLLHVIGSLFRSGAYSFYIFSVPAIGLITTLLLSIHQNAPRRSRVYLIISFDGWFKRKSYRNSLIK